MPIRVQCDCGHEVTVNDRMAGKKGRCPECSAVVSIPGNASKGGRGGVYAPVPRAQRSRSYGWLSGVAILLTLVAFASLMLWFGMGVFSAVAAVRDPEAFRGPWGLLAGLAPSVQAQPLLMAAAFAVGGAIAGCVNFLVIAAVSQMLRLFVSLDRSLAEISEHLAERRS